MPIASTSPNSDRLLSENPRAAITANVPMSETGIARIGMIEARHDCRNAMTTMTTSSAASKIVWMTALNRFVDEDGRIVDDAVFDALREILAQSSRMRSRTRSAVAKAFEPGRCWMAMATAGLPSR